MKESDLSFFNEFFRDYTSKFHSSERDVEELIEMKIAHTYRVRDNCRELGLESGLSGNDLRLAETIGLFHDIGRFEQSVRYSTLHDSRSEDHAALGVKVLKREGVLNHLSEREREIIFTAIRLHNAKALPEIKDMDALFFCRLIRDADKLDIYRVVTDYYEGNRKRRNPLIELELEDRPAYSPALVQDILNNRPSDARLMRTLNDMKLLQLGWVFDINFPPTLKRICEHRYLERILAHLPDNEEIRNVGVHLRDYVKGRLAEE